MNAVIFYSNTGQSEHIASYFSSKLEYPLIDIEKNIKYQYENLVLVFPVHCQNIPYVVKDFLTKITAKNLTVVATYGKLCTGNVLYEIQQKYQKSIVAGAYVPTKHSYIDEDEIFCNFEILNPILEKIKNPSFVIFPRLYKNPFASF